MQSANVAAAKKKILVCIEQASGLARSRAEREAYEKGPFWLLCFGDAQATKAASAYAPARP